LVESVDLYQTLAEVCGLPSPSGREGVSFAPLLDNPDLQWKKAVFSQVKRVSVMGRDVRTKQYGYNSWGAAGEELYNHIADPHEYTNLATNPQYASVLKEMRAILADGWRKSLLPPAALSALQVNSTQAVSLQKADMEKSLVLGVYPNPNNGQFVINLHVDKSINTNVKIELVNMMWQTVYTENGSINNGRLKKNISMPSSLSQGIYMVKVTVTNKVYLVKLIYSK